MKEIIRIFGLCVLLALFPERLSAQSPFDKFGNLRCEGTPIRYGGGWACQCPDGTLARMEMRGGVYVGVCNRGHASPPRSYVPAPPSAAPDFIPYAGRPKTVPVPYGKGCLSGERLFRLIAGNRLLARSLKTGKRWNVEGRWESLIFQYSSGKAEINFWKVKGKYIILFSERGKFLGKRMICKISGKLYWVNANSGRPMARILRVEELTDLE